MSFHRQAAGNRRKPESVCRGEGELEPFVSFGRPIIAGIGITTSIWLRDTKRETQQTCWKTPFTLG
ncbi:MAG: hypothetical protein DME53_03310 [Verrucomicrobia bacterium]|nr:MAG: hypothetical protein DME53_03310 [Verrucomicrobiota bacterium]